MYGVSTLVIPLTMSFVYKASSFTTALDILSFVIALNGIAFLIYAALNNWNREPHPLLNIDEKYEEGQGEEPLLVNESRRTE